MSLLFEPYDLAGLTLPNRVVMAPMTRSRAVNDAPNDMTELYYSQRASAGLIVTEGVPVSPEGRGYLFTPGLYSDDQVAGWSRVTEAVHRAGGRIFVQLWHVGRISHTSVQPDGGQPVSALTRPAETATAYGYDETGASGKVDVSPARALETDEVPRVTADFVRAAELAMQAGFDGVEIHGANGYLFEQFINPCANDRTDAYGGSVENRLRFTLDTVDAVAAAIGGARVGIRISPFGRLHDMKPFEGEGETWLRLAKEFDARTLAYVHLSDQLTIGAERMPDGFPRRFREAYSGTLIAAGGFDRDSGEAALQAGDLDLIAIGKPYISNPDLVERMQNDWPLTPARREDYYNHSEKGYIDYPPYRATRPAAAGGD